MRLDLDPVDFNLLKEIEEFGEVTSAVLDQSHRLERLELEGYVASVPARSARIGHSTKMGL